MSTTLDWAAFDPSNAIGDAGRQPAILAATGPLNVGVPDTALDFLSLDPIEIRACSSRGWSHRYKGTPRQDSYSLLVNDDLVVIAVADGVSEGEYSQVAAETAARSACKLAADQISRAGVVDWVQLGRRISLRIIEEAEYRQIAVSAADWSIDDRLRACRSKMSSTLLVAVVRRSPDPLGWAAEIAVVAGDSAAYLLRAGRLAPIGGGKDLSGPITSTGVRPLPGAVEPQIATLALRPGDALILSSDGIGDPVGDGSGDMGRELARRWRTPPTIDQFLLDVNVYRRSYDDDRTAVGLWIWPSAGVPDGIEPSVVDAEEGAGAEAPKADAAGDHPDQSDEIVPAEPTDKMSGPNPGADEDASVLPPPIVVDDSPALETRRS